MNRIFLFIISIISFLLQACNTMLNTSTIKMEIVVPAQVKIPSDYKNIVIMYNNVNSSYNPANAIYTEGQAVKTDTYNTDSLAARIYFNTFVENLNNQILFDSVKVLAPANYSNIKVIDTFNISDTTFNDSLRQSNLNYPAKPVWLLSKLLNQIEHDSTDNNKEIKILDPELGLYSKDDIQQIEDSTHADLLFSFDYFSSYDGIDFDDTSGIEAVFSTPFWNIYDLKKQAYIFYYFKEDTLLWENIDAHSLKTSIKFLPPRKDAVLNAAEESATGFARFIAPYWLEVERMYYRSGNTEMQKAEKLMKQNKWLEAAEIWKRNIKSKNKSIVAKSMFNLGLACEMEGQLDAAIDWLVKSYNILKDQNIEHYYNCIGYIGILGQRKQDIRVIDSYFNPTVEDSLLKKSE